MSIGRDIVQTTTSKGNSNWGLLPLVFVSKYAENLKIFLSTNKIKW